MQMQKMNSQRFEIFQKITITEYAKLHSKEYNISETESIKVATEAISHYLPLGLETPHHYFYDLISNEKHCAYLWFGIRENHGKKRIFIFDIFVQDSARGKGCGKFMINWLESETKKLGLNEIYLHVFGRNIIARSLYENTGFEITNLYMAKKL